MIVLAILSTLAAAGCTVFIVFANGMSDAPGAGFQGEWVIIVAWAVTAALWAGWIFR